MLGTMFGDGGAGCYVLGFWVKMNLMRWTVEIQSRSPPNPNLNLMKWTLVIQYRSPPNPF